MLSEKETFNRGLDLTFHMSKFIDNHYKTIYQPLSFLVLQQGVSGILPFINHFFSLFEESRVFLVKYAFTGSCLQVKRCKRICSFKTGAHINERL